MVYTKEMPWMETDACQQRQRFIAALQSGLWSMTELCLRFGLSRPTGYLWRDRAARGEALTDRSHAPHACPHRLSDDVAALVIAARREYGWGAKKLVAVLARRHPHLTWPALSTVNDLLARHQLLRRRRRPPTRWAHPGAAALVTTRPNQVWPADFKGQFKTGDGHYCYPLTVTDHFSRALLVCRGLASTSRADTQAVFRALFRTVGLPDAIRTDNGTPFASPALHGLSALNVWWMQLGIVHQRIPPASPQYNGTHERMHRELKRETTRPAAATRRAQQRRFETFRTRYNDDRPHEALDDRTPASVWVPSTRVYPERRPAPAYPATLDVRRVGSNGGFSWGGRAIFLSETLAGEDVGFEEVADDVWNIVYYRTVLGRLDARAATISAAQPV
jgi:transposase InsO family protein